VRDRTVVYTELGLEAADQQWDGAYRERLDHCRNTHPPKSAGAEQCFGAWYDADQQVDGAVRAAVALFAHVLDRASRGQQATGLGGDAGPGSYDRAGPAAPSSAVFREDQRSEMSTPLPSEIVAVAKYITRLIAQGLDREAIAERLLDPAEVGSRMIDRAIERRAEGAEYLGRGEQVLVEIEGPDFAMPAERGKG